MIVAVSVSKVDVSVVAVLVPGIIVDSLVVGVPVVCSVVSDPDVNRVVERVSVCVEVAGCAVVAVTEVDSLVHRAAVEI